VVTTLATLIGARFTLGIAVLGGIGTALYVARAFSRHRQPEAMELNG
jgi:hypothetical protein